MSRVEIKRNVQKVYMGLILVYMEGPFRYSRLTWGVHVVVA